MSPFLLRLFLLSLRGRLRRWGRQLQEPKYLIGFSLGTGWILLWATSWGSGRSWGRVFLSGFQERIAEEVQVPVQLVVSVLFAAFLSVSWLLPAGRLTLPLKESELHFLLPAPLNRRQIIQYALLKGQVPILFTSILFSVFMASSRGGSWLRVWLALWLFLTLWELHNKWRTLCLLRLRQLPMAAAWRRRIALFGGLVVFWAVLGPRIYSLIERFGTTLLRASSEKGADLDTVLARLSEIQPDALSMGMLTPARWITGPLFASSTAQFLLALGPAVLVLVAVHEAVVRSRARFEEAAFEHAKHLVRLRSPTRRLERLSAKSRQREPFPLPAQGRPEVAVLWKNLMQFTRLPLKLAAAWAVVAIASATLLPGILNTHELPLWILMIAGGWLLVFGPLLAGLSFRNDLRTELQHLELVRTWPVSGFRLVLAEVLSPALLGTLLATCGGVVLLGATIGAGLKSWLHGVDVDTVVLSAEAEKALHMPGELFLTLGLVSYLPLAGAVAALASCLPNMGVLLFPAWVGIGPQAARGMAASGQHLLTAMAFGLIIMITGIPSAMLVGIAVLAQWLVGIPFAPPWPLPLWGLLAAMPPFIGAILLVRAGGRLWEGLDPSREVLEAGR